MPNYKLTYFNLRARAEVPRILMAYGGIKYEDVRITSEEWAKLKPNTPFGQLPMFEVDDKVFCQSEAISRYLAKEVGLYGKTAEEALKIDMVMGCISDAYQPIIAIFKEKDEAKKAEMKKDFAEKFDGELQKMEKLMDGDFFVGGEMTLADIVFAEGLTFPGAIGITVSVDKAPRLAELREKVFQHPKIAPWIQSRPETTF